ncbi:siderophore-interacting protein [Shigella boydii]
MVLGGEALDGFTSRGFDDHGKPLPDLTLTSAANGDGRGHRLAGRTTPPSRNYTPLYDDCAMKLAIDFFIHDGGVASGWAMQAQPGDKLTVAGPRGSLVVPEDYAYQLYVCDESGMPALRRRLETLSKLAVKPQVSALVSVRDNACQDYLAHLDGFNIEWLAHDEQAVDARLAQMQIPADDYFIWITGEGKVVKNLSRRFEAEQYDPQRVRAAAYWHAK